MYHKITIVKVFVFTFLNQGDILTIVTIWYTILRLIFFNKQANRDFHIHFKMFYAFRYTKNGSSPNINLSDELTVIAFLAYFLQYKL